MVFWSFSRYLLSAHYVSPVMRAGDIPRFGTWKWSGDSTAWWARTQNSGVKEVAWLSHVFAGDPLATSSTYWMLSFLIWKIGWKRFSPHFVKKKMLVKSTEQGACYLLRKLLRMVNYIIIRATMLFLQSRNGPFLENGGSFPTPRRI